MKIPESVKIGEKTYKINTVKRIGFRNNVVGNIDYQREKIKLILVKDQRMNEDNFFHEIAHGVLKEMEYNYPKMIRFRNNEKFTQELGLVIRTVFKDLTRRRVKN